MPGILGPTYSVSSPTGRCAATGRPIAPGEAYIAVLVEREGTEELERADYCAAAWQSGSRPAPPLGVFASWRAVMPEPSQPRPALIDQASALDLFEQLGQSDERRRVACRFVLALILLRRRVLRHLGSGRDGQGRAVMRVRWAGADRAEEPEVEVLDPGLSGDDVEEVCRLLGEVGVAPEGGGA